MVCSGTHLVSRVPSSGSVQNKKGKDSSPRIYLGMERVEAWVQHSGFSGICLTGFYLTYLRVLTTTACYRSLGATEYKRELGSLLLLQKTCNTAWWPLTQEGKNKKGTCSKVTVLFFRGCLSDWILVQPSCNTNRPGIL